MATSHHAGSASSSDRLAAPLAERSPPRGPNPLRAHPLHSGCGSERSGPSSFRRCRRGFPLVAAPIRPGKVIEAAGSRSFLVSTPAGLVRRVLAVLDVIGLSLLVPEQYEIADTDFIVDIESTERKLGWVPQYDDAIMLMDAYREYQAGSRNAMVEAHCAIRIAGAVRARPDIGVGPTLSVLTPQKAMVHPG